ncbi:MAG: HI0074 family nucleotidyltransferase substrate-binding subunit [Patescibacteria group bacterium]
MAYLKEKFVLLRKALKAWDKVLIEPYSEIVRDATIQRYEFSCELFWKCVKIFLKEYEGIDCNSPKSCFRALKGILKLTEKDVLLCLEMVDDRNLSVHTYSEALAKALYRRTRRYFEVVKRIFAEIEGRVS